MGRLSSWRCADERACGTNQQLDNRQRALHLYDSEAVAKTSFQPVRKVQCHRRRDVALAETAKSYSKVIVVIVTRFSTEIHRR